MSDQNYPGLALVQNFLDKLDINRVDMELECAGDQPSKNKEKKDIFPPED